jgi:hypothetical protein
MKSLGKNISLQGELIGEGIQGNPYKLKGQTIRFFTGYDIDKQERLNLRDFIVILELLGLQSVPILSIEFFLPDSVEQLLQQAEGKSVLNPDTEREGVVVRSMDSSISFKAISNKFLLNHE